MQITLLLHLIEKNKLEKLHFLREQNTAQPNSYASYVAGILSWFLSVHVILRLMSTRILHYGENLHKRRHNNLAKLFHIFITALRALLGNNIKIFMCVSRGRVNLH